MKLLGEEKKGIFNLKNIKKVKKIQTIMVIVAIVVSCLLFLNNTFASTELENIKVSAFNIASKAIQIILYAIRFVFLILALVLYTVISLVFAGEFVSVDKIFFGKVSFLNLDFLLGGQSKKIGASYTDALSQVYWVIFFLAVGIHFLLLLYGSVKSMLETQTADKKAQNKELLTSWAKGMAMLFGIIFIAFAMLYINDYICKALDTAIQHVDGLSGNFILDLAGRSISGIGLDANIAFMFTIAIMVITSIMFFYYIRRAVKIGYLIVISPIISLTYVTGGLNGTSKAYGNWIKEFSSNVFIQMFHILIYVSLILPMSSLGQVEKETNIFRYIPTLLLVFFGLGFIYNAEKLIKKLFAQHISKAEDSKTSLASVIAVKQLADTAANIAKKGKELLGSGGGSNRTGDIKLKDDGGDNSKDIKKAENTEANGTNENLPDTKDTGNTSLDEENTSIDKLDTEDAGDTSTQTEDNEEINVDELEDAGVKLTTFDKIKIAAKRSSAKESKKLSGTDNIKDKKEKKGFKKKFKKAAVSAAKFGLKVGGAYTGAIIGQAANQEMFVGATVGGFAGYKATEKALDSASNYRGLTASKKNENYVNSVRNSARQQVKNVDRAGKIGTYDKNGKLKSFNTDARTEEGKRNVREYYKDVIKKSNQKDSNGESKLDKEYKKAHQEYIKSLVKEKKISAEEAARAADQLIDYILSDKKLIIEDLNEAERKFIKAINDQQIAMDMKAFTEYTKPLEQNKKVEMQKDVLTDLDGVDMGAVEDMITLLGEAKEEVSGKLNTGNDTNSNGQNNQSNNTDNIAYLRDEMDEKYVDVLPEKLRNNPRYDYTYYDYLNEEDEENDEEDEKDSN